MARRHDGFAPLISAGAAEAGERPRRELEFLADAGALLAAPLDCEDALGQLARMAVPFLGDWCQACVFEPNGWLRRLGSPVDPIDFGDVEGLIRQQREPAILTRLSPRVGAAMVAPIAQDGRLAATLIVAAAARDYTSEDLDLWQGVARQCASMLARTRITRESAAALRAALEASRAKDDFLAILSHELRNPLMPILGWARIFKGHSEILRDPVLKEGALSLERNAETVARLVGDCLDVSRISQGKISIQHQTVDLNKVILASTEVVRQAAWEKNLGLVAELSAGPLWVSGDRTRLQQVLMNLLVNAVKFTDSGGRVSVRSSRYSCDAANEEAEIEVSDTGRGLEADQLEEIFQPFRQVAGVYQSSSTGLGLGLAIARQIVNLHHGRIWAVSKGPGLGSVFRMRMPLISPSVDEEQDSTVPHSGDSSHPLRILLVEDAKDILMLTKIQLEALGHVVFIAHDGHQGLDQALRERPDVIISDLKMPGSDGFSLLRRIRDLPELASIPAIALTGLSTPGELERSRQAGFDVCLVKPVDTSELTGWIARLTPPRSR